MLVVNIGLPNALHADDAQHQVLPLLLTSLALDPTGGRPPRRSLCLTRLATTKGERHGYIYSRRTPTASRTAPRLQAAEAEAEVEVEVEAEA